MPPSTRKCYGLGVPALSRFSLVLLSSGLILSGCARATVGSGPKAPAAQGAIQAAAVSDEAFAASLHRLLRDGKSTPERLSLLAGVVARQLVHAKERFVAGQRDRGLSSMNGAFFLVRAGEFRNEMVTGGEPALSSAIAVTAPQGDEGRTVAFLTMKNTLVPEGSAARRDNEEHLAALRTWMQDIRRGHGLEALGDEQRVQAMRSLVEPTAESLRTAREATVLWIDQALKKKLGF